MELNKIRVTLALIGLVVLDARLSGQEAPARTRLLFMGDIMCHDTQMAAAFNPQTGTYDFSDSFASIKDLVGSADLTFANLEMTLAGPPYTTFPMFSAPDAMAKAVKDCGVDVLLTANNHACDKRQLGIERTIKVLDSLGLKHTGTYAGLEQWRNNCPLFVESNGIGLAVLNYTYGTNGMPKSKGTYVAEIDTTMMKMDLAVAKAHSPDAVIVFLHWGNEYAQQPGPRQQWLVRFLTSNGVDLVIGSHPHVLQRMEWHRFGPRNYLVAYSLGNFVSGQRTQPRDGAAVLDVELTKRNGKTTITDAGYTLTYVHYPRINGVRHFRVVPAAAWLNNGLGKTADGNRWDRLPEFVANARQLLRANINVHERK